MGLFSNRSSSTSTSTTQNFQESNSLNSNLSGVNTDGAIITGSNNSVVSYFDTNVANSFDGLVGLVSDAFDNVTDLTGETLKSLESSNTKSLNAIVDANQQVQNPTFNALADMTTKVIPLAMFAVGAMVIIKIMPNIKGMLK